MRNGQQGAGPGDQGTSGEVVGPVDDQVVVGHQGQDARLVQAPVDGVHGGRAGDPGHGVPGRIHLAATHISLTVKDLPLEVGEVDQVVVDDGQGAHPGRGEVEGRRRAEPTGSDEEHTRVRQATLALLTDTGKEQVPRVPRALGGRQRRAGGNECGSRHTPHPTAVG